MKKTIISVGTTAGKRQLRILKNYPFNQLFTTEMGIIVLFAATRAPIIKGNLGFDINERDGDFIRKSLAIHAAIFANVAGYYTPPFGALAALATAISTFQDTIADLEAGVYGAEAAKVDAKRDVMRLLKKALNFVNDIAFDRQDVAAEAITGAKMILNKPISQDKPDLKAVASTAAGEVKLYAKAVKIGPKYVQATYEWQFSIDDGRTWENLPLSNKAKTIAIGMLSGIKTSFRKRSFNENLGQSPWSEMVSAFPL